MDQNTETQGDGTQQMEDVVNGVQNQPEETMPPPSEYDSITAELQQRPNNPSGWKRLIDLAENSGDLDKIRASFDALLQQYPNTSSAQIRYIGHFLQDPSTFSEAEDLFKKFLVKSPEVELWKFYLVYVRRVNTGPSTRDAVRKSYEFALNHVGQDKDSGEIWKDYIQFLRAGDASTTWEEQQKMDALRKVYHRAVQIPLEGVETLWQELESFENNLNRITAKKFMSDLSPAHMQARTTFRQLINHTASLFTSHVSSAFNRPELELPALPTFNTAERSLVGKWKAYLKWEENNPLELEEKDKSTLVARIHSVYRKALIRMRYYAEVWFMAYTWLNSVGKHDEALTILKTGIEANPSSFLLTFAYAEALELKKDFAETEEALNAANAPADPPPATNGTEPATQTQPQTSSSGASDDKPKKPTEFSERQSEYGLAWIVYMRFGRRAEGIKSSRAIFGKARKDKWTPWEVYEAAALMEYHCSQDKNVGSRIFEKGLDHFADEIEYVLRYLGFLISVNDENNARALFERVIGTFPADRARPLWERWARYEYQYGDLQASLDLEARVAKVYPSDPPIKRFAQRHTYLGVDAIAAQDLGFALARKAPQSMSRIEPNPPAVGNNSIIPPASHAPNKRAASPENNRKRDDRGGQDYGQSHKRARGASPPPRGDRDRDRYDGPQARRRSPPPPAWEREGRDRPPREDEKPRQPTIPNVLSWFVGELPTPASFDGPVFRTEDLMNLFRNAVIPSSTRARTPPPTPPRTGGRPPPDYGPYQGPGGGRPGRRCVIWPYTATPQPPNMDDSSVCKLLTFLFSKDEGWSKQRSVTSIISVVILEDPTFTIITSQPSSQIYSWSAAHFSLDQSVLQLQWVLSRSSLFHLLLTSTPKMFVVNNMDRVLLALLSLFLLSRLDSSELNTLFSVSLTLATSSGLPIVDVLYSYSGLLVRRYINDRVRRDPRGKFLSWSTSELACAVSSAVAIRQSLPSMAASFITPELVQQWMCDVAGFVVLIASLAPPLIFEVMPNVVSSIRLQEFEDVLLQGDRTLIQSPSPSIKKKSIFLEDDYRTPEWPRVPLRYPLPVLPPNFFASLDRPPNDSEGTIDNGDTPEATSNRDTRHSLNQLVTSTSQSTPGMDERSSVDGLSEKITATVVEESPNVEVHAAIPECPPGMIFDNRCFLHTDLSTVNIDNKVQDLDSESAEATTTDRLSEPAIQDSPDNCKGGWSLEVLMDQNSIASFEEEPMDENSIASFEEEPILETQDRTAFYTRRPVPIFHESYAHLWGAQQSNATAYTSKDLNRDIIDNNSTPSSTIDKKETFPQEIPASDVASHDQPPPSQEHAGCRMDREQEVIRISVEATTTDRLSEPPILDSPDNCKGGWSLEVLMDDNSIASFEEEPVFETEDPTAFFTRRPVPTCHESYFHLWGAEQKETFPQEIRASDMASQSSTPSQEHARCKRTAHEQEILRIEELQAKNDEDLAELDRQYAKLKALQLELRAKLPATPPRIPELNLIEASPESERVDPIQGRLDPSQFPEFVEEASPLRLDVSPVKQKRAASPSVDFVDDPEFPCLSEKEADNYPSLLRSKCLDDLPPEADTSDEWKLSQQMINFWAERKKRKGAENPPLPVSISKLSIQVDYNGVDFDRSFGDLDDRVVYGDPEEPCVPGDSRLKCLVSPASTKPTETIVEVCGKITAMLDELQAVREMKAQEADETPTDEISDEVLISAGTSRSPPHHDQAPGSRVIAKQPATSGPVTGLTRRLSTTRPSSRAVPTETTTTRSRRASAPASTSTRPAATPALHPRPSNTAASTANKAPASRPSKSTTSSKSSSAATKPTTSSSSAVAQRNVTRRHSSSSVTSEQRPDRSRLSLPPSNVISKQTSRPTTDATRKSLPVTRATRQSLLPPPKTSSAVSITPTSEPPVTRAIASTSAKSSAPGPASSTSVQKKTTQRPSLPPPDNTKICRQAAAAAGRKSLPITRVTRQSLLPPAKTPSQPGPKAKTPLASNAKPKPEDAAPQVQPAQVGTLKPPNAKVRDSFLSPKTITQSTFQDKALSSRRAPLAPVKTNLPVDPVELKGSRLRAPSPRLSVSGVPPR
ncbi:hypothetical protein H0H93_014038 [Arthromyces matolae]|nr:hypothetical protein H0H93_014038 [Arthromyces matolae]